MDSDKEWTPPRDLLWDVVKLLDSDFEPYGNVRVTMTMDRIAHADVNFTWR